MTEASRILTAMPEGKRSLCIPKGVCEDVIKMNLQELGW
jgi:hypothetical protein